MIQVKEMMQDKDLKNSKSKDKGSRSRSQSMNEQSHYKQEKTKTRPKKAKLKRHIFNIRGDNDKTRKPPTRMLSVVQECQHKRSRGKEKEIKKGMRHRDSCSLCGGTNHNKRTCTGIFKDQDEVAVAQDEVVQEIVDLVKNEEELI
ncbi:hypothetical protein Tco_0390593 [Tanacetum coccineum]